VTCALVVQRPRKKVDALVIAEAFVDGRESMHRSIESAARNRLTKHRMHIRRRPRRCPQLAEGRLLVGAIPARHDTADIGRPEEQLRDTEAAARPGRDPPYAPRRQVRLRGLPTSGNRLELSTPVGVLTFAARAFTLSLSASALLEHYSSITRALLEHYSSAQRDTRLETSRFTFTASLTKVTDLRRL
jgi:hypothetical protein